MNRSKKIYVSPEQYAVLEERAKAERKTVNQYVGDELRAILKAIELRTVLKGEN